MIHITLKKHVFLRRKDEELLILVDDAIHSNS